MGVLQLEKVAFEGVTESKQICIICKTQGRNTRRGGVDSFMQFRDVKQEKNRGERRALRNTTMNRNRRRFRVIKNKSSRVIGAEGVDSGGECEADGVMIAVQTVWLREERGLSLCRPVAGTIGSAVGPKR